MSAFTLERKMALPVACTDCQWLGKVAELRARGTDPAGQWHCPRCGSSFIKFIESTGTATIQ